MRGNARKGLRSTQSPTKFAQNPREIQAKFAHISRICLKNPRVNFSSRDRLKAHAFSAAEVRAWNGEEATSELTEWLLKSLLLFSKCEICTCMLILFKKCNMSANNYMRGKKKKKKKKKCPSLFLAADPSTVSRHTEKKKKKKKKRSDAWSSSRDNVIFFLILRAQYLVSVKSYRATWSKKSPCSGSLRRRTAELI